MKSLSPEFAFYLYRTIIWSFTECYRHVYAGAPNFYLDILDDLQK